ncbi:glucosaminidase domain-containing protein [Lentilactobacillus diolivorans]|mgnify:FL=1|uniref:glycoside hydrolase family 73 protein n=1 Tax=Lentilactobacillus diolivorans TaxID=179838 RepID=UPI002468A621|nr:glucosaminidase domain-containing protein [Lentilactobacillus diolivorans]MDH5106095.1 glucosaminidase domain-containing protein [Lentilactobacillus diolivorans]
MHQKNIFVKVIACFVAVISFTFLSAGQVNASVETDFINQLRAPVVKVSRQNHLYPSIMMAQAIVESDFGQSGLSVQANNYFGVKGSYDGQYVNMSTGEYSSKGKHYVTVAQFKKYPNVLASIKDNAYLLRHGTLTDPDYYSGTWTTTAITATDAAMALSSTYATDMAYGNKLNAVITKYHLDKLDEQSGAASDSGDINSQIERQLKKQLGGTTTKVQPKSEAKNIPSKITNINQPIVKNFVFSKDPKVSQPGSLDSDNDFNLPIRTIIKK